MTDTRDALTEALRVHRGLRLDELCGRIDLAHLADALVPVVDRLRRETAAQELDDLRTSLAVDEDATTDAALQGLDFTLDVLRARAATVRANTQED